MRRLLDRLMYRLGYVTKERYFRAAAPRIVAALDRMTDEMRDDCVYRDNAIVVTTDYRRGTPCS